MSLSDLAAFDRAAFSDPTTGFGELVIYRPAGVGTTPRSMYATVRRHAPSQVAATSAAAPLTEISIRHHATDGVTSIGASGDRFDVAEQPGGPLLTRQVVKAIPDAGGWMITLR